jgi:hypothetical protein
MKTQKSYLLLVTALLLLVSLACRTLIPETTAGEELKIQPNVKKEPLEIENTPDSHESEGAEEGVLESEADEHRPRKDEWEGDEEFFAVPEMSGKEEILDTEHFRIHYTLKGKDKVPNMTYINTVAEIMEHVYQVQVEQMGWPAPPPDNGFGGDERYDIYILNIFEDGTAGYADGGFPETLVGDNPNSLPVEARSHYSYLALDNDYAELEDFGAENESVTAVLQSTAAHEFNHAIQFAMDGEEPLEWLWEATATWIQGQVYPHVRDADEDLLAVVKSPDTCQAAYGGETRVEDENHWYGLWIFLQYISENYGPETVRSIWENAQELDGYEALEVALFDAGTTLDAAFREFSLALLARGFDRGAEFPTLRLEGEASIESVFTPRDGVGQLAADYVEIQTGGTVAIRLNAENLSGLVVGLRNGEMSVFNMVTNQASINTADFDHVYLLIINYDRAETEYDCQFTPYTVTVEATNQPADPPTSQVAAPNFTPPEIEELLDPDEYWGAGWDEETGESIAAPAELIPNYIPTGYELADSYEVDQDYFEEDADWYLPGDGPGIVLDFWGPGEYDFFAITASDSPYKTLSAYLTAIDYEPEADELQTIAGIPALVEDWSEPGDPYSAVTLIVAGQFIVIDGTLEVVEMVKIAASLIP